MQDRNAGDIQFDFGHTGQIIAGFAAVGFQAPQFHDVSEDRHQFLEHLAQCGTGQHVPEGLGAIAHHFRIHGKEIGQGRAFQVKNLCHAQFFEGIHINIRCILPGQMTLFCGSVRVNQAEIAKFHRGIPFR